MVQQRRHEGEEHLPPLPQALPGDGHRQMSLAGAAIAGEQQPPFRECGEGLGSVEGAGQCLLVILGSPETTRDVKGGEGHAGQHLGPHLSDAQGEAAVKVAQMHQPGAPLGVEPGAERFVQPRQWPPDGYDSGQGVVVAVVDNLEQLFLGPRRRAVSAKVVENQHRHVAHLLEQLVVGELAVGGVGGPQVVQKIGHHDEEGGLLPLDAAVGNGRGQVGLAAAGRPGENQPALGVLGVGRRLWQGLGEQPPRRHVGQRPLGAGGGESEAREGPQIAVTAQRLHAGGQRILGLAALAGRGLPELGMPHGDTVGHPTASVAVGAVVSASRFREWRDHAAVRSLGYTSFADSA